MINPHTPHLLKPLTIIIPLPTRRGQIELPAPLEPKQLVHLIDAQPLGVVDEEERVHAGAHQTGCEEDVHAPPHAGVHLRESFGHDERPDPHAGGGEGAGDRAHGGGEDLGGDDPGETVGLFVC